MILLERNVAMGVNHAEVVIIGGGIIGAAIAYFLGREGVNVIVLEKGELASGTSSRCDGNILAIDKDPGFDSQMSLTSQRIIDELSRELSSPFEYRLPGSILVCESDEEMEAAQLWVNRQKALGLSFRMLDRGDIRQESPFLADDLPGGLECGTDSTVNPYLLTFALFDDAQKKYGVRVSLNTEVKSILRNPLTADFKICTTQGDFSARKIVNAAGVWAPVIGQMVGIDIPIVPRKGHLIVASRQVPVGMRKVMEFGYLISKFGGERKVDPLTEKYGVALVFEPTESQNFLIGSSREFVGFDTTVNMEAIRTMARRTLRFYPKIGDFHVIRTYTGLRPWTQDHLPIVSAVDEVPGFYIAAGHEGDGISLAAVTGKLMSQMITEQPDTVISTEPLKFERFRKKVNHA
ncbi:FAD-binding oxidoreductase [Paenibacillus sp. KQZ6P-2]|uniref:Aerobic glycerol-3-phosphate dehydrogenase n=1 Tax=Paenibacillus mangrovi TaxID=2931978 RepID=A0A9X1WRN5_9BACL|nr:FAD-dependent oxidoreductase [Paenibacillus mangrovi]MCJ8013466.1 FAD-binding oxidoreductase [Paenibacillus mangrovi]